MSFKQHWGSLAWNVLGRCCNAKQFKTDWVFWGCPETLVVGVIGLWRFAAGFSTSQVAQPGGRWLLHGFLCPSVSAVPGAMQLTGDLPGLAGCSLISTRKTVKPRGLFKDPDIQISMPHGCPRFPQNDAMATAGFLLGTTMHHQLLSTHNQGYRSTCPSH